MDAKLAAHRYYGDAQLYPLRQLLRWLDSFLGEEDEGAAAPSCCFELAIAPPWRRCIASATRGETLTQREARLRALLATETEAGGGLQAAGSFAAPEHGARLESVACARDAGCLAFDIDANDLKATRAPCGCTEKREVCARCWPVVAAGARALGHVLQEAFGYADTLYVFSGRRGVHLWVQDAAARALPLDVRAAMCDLLSVAEWKAAARGDGGGVRAPMRDAIARFLLPAYARYVQQPHATLQQAAEMAPPIDVNFTAAANHCRKLPFTVHASDARGRLCFPVHVDALCTSFDPLSSPTVHNITPAQTAAAAALLARRGRRQQDMDMEEDQ